MFPSLVMFGELIYKALRLFSTILQYGVIPITRICLPDRDIVLYVYLYHPVAIYTREPIGKP